ncbi:MAG: MBL fold metallo-hydrolase [Planctomycetota bacterium]
MDVPRPSSAVVLTRGGGRELEVFLVRRAPALRFLGGYWAFPGGVVDPMDGVAGEEEDGSTATRCAIRELFEETGVLPSSLAAAIAPAQREALREELARPGAVVPRWRELLAATPGALAELTRFARLTTPPFSRLRYRTDFFHLALPPGEAPDFAAGELVAGRFWRPAELLAAWRAGDLHVSPPTLMQLGLDAGRGAEAWLAACRRECGRLEAGRLESVRQAPGILALPLRTPTPPPGISTSTYLVGEERVWIVDPAPVDEGERARLLEITDEWHREGRSFAGVLLTHHHPDHVGAAELVAARYGLSVHAHPWTLAHLPFRPRDPRPLFDGDELDLGTAPTGTPRWRLRALHTPGHAPGHLAFLESRYRALIAGDMLATGSTILIDPPEGHLATYLASLRRLARERIGTLHPAHGMPHLDGPALVGQYLAHRREREEKLRAALAATPRSLGELVAVVYDDTPVELHPLARRSLLAGLEKLRDEGRAAEAEGGWRAGGQ